jgi:hypothetical protein
MKLNSMNEVEQSLLNPGTVYTDLALVSNEYGNRSPRYFKAINAIADSSSKKYQVQTGI